MIEIEEDRVTKERLVMVSFWVSLIYVMVVIDRCCSDILYHTFG